MNINDALETLKLFDPDCPNEALADVRAQWPGAEPLLLDEIDRVLAGLVSQSRSRSKRSSSSRPR